MSRETYQEVIDINLTGVCQSIKAASAHMITRKQGWIVAMSSATGCRAVPSIARYSAAKLGPVGLMKAALLKLGLHASG